ncbi:class I SAM-dependent methyltransferase [Streptomyces sp. NPDC059740]|uniref:class I SAM-dependent methyltransferase n=1 Tax=Streptomyces sp. NPDC059740 TaxID=3346926 RepID=UPI0036687A5B
MLHAEFRDPRLVAVYDAEFGWGPDDDHFLAVARERPGSRVVDLGCGTGRLTLALAAAGHRVTGVDPAAASLRAARAKPGSAGVTWLTGTSSLLPDASFDLAVMTSHVSGFLTTDESWRGTLADLHRALVPGGRLAFDSHDRAGRAWERWNPRDSRRTVTLSGGRPVTCWTEVTAVRGDLVDFTLHYAFPDGEELVSTATLRFRTEESLCADLAAAGFEVERVAGGWHGEPVGAGEGELVVLAHR